jgi:predicted RNase H-like nuclease (RuvC/YqgF family)
MEAARDRIEQLELQIEYLQEHIDGLDKEVAAMEQEQGTIHAAILHDKNQIAIELDKEKSRTKDLMKNLSQLERMVTELNELKAGSQRGTFY